MNRRKRNALTCSLGVLTLSLLSVAPAVLAGERYVAGSAPHQRPAGAPVIKTFNASAEWRKAALTGVSEPLPPSLKFLDSQGAWYTPFDQRGMPGYYDLRGMHSAPAKTKP
jgi:hypothetical protein